jgi:uncharacterized protein
MPERVLTSAFVPLSYGADKGLFLAKENKISLISDDLFNEVSKISNRPDHSEDYLLSIMTPSLIDTLFFDTSEVIHNLHSKPHIPRDCYHVTIELTKKCNLRCRYCFSSHLDNTIDNCDFNSNNISQMTDYLVRIAGSRHVSMSFYGGEPLLNYNIINKILNDAKIKGMKLSSVSLTTNLTILNEDVISILIKHNIKLLVSLDGYAEIHDLNRLFMTGKGSHAIVVRNLRKLMNSGFNKDNLNINCVVSPFTDLSKLIDYISTELSSLIDGDVFSKIGFSFICENNSSKRYIDTVPQECRLPTSLDYEAIINALDIFNVYANIIKTPEQLFVRNIWKKRIDKVLIMLFGQIDNYDISVNLCYPGDTQCYVSTEGKVYTCNFLCNQDELQIGTLEQGLIEPYCENLFLASQRLLEQCHFCWNKLFCSPCLARMYDYGRNSIDKDYFIRNHCVGEKELSSVILNSVFKLVRTRYDQIPQILSNI